MSVMSSHVQSVYSKANSTLGFLRRNLRRCPAKLKKSAYILLVRSTLEYAASVWDPHLGPGQGHQQVRKHTEEIGKIC